MYCGFRSNYTPTHVHHSEIARVLSIFSERSYDKQLQLCWPSVPLFHPTRFLLFQLRNPLHAIISPPSNTVELYPQLTCLRSSFRLAISAAFSSLLMPAVLAGGGTGDVTRDISPEPAGVGVVGRGLAVGVGDTGFKPGLGLGVATVAFCG
jgi:hypothetical protein